MDGVTVKPKSQVDELKRVDPSDRSAFCTTILSPRTSLPHHSSSRSLHPAQSQSWPSEKHARANRRSLRRSPRNFDRRSRPA